MADATPTHVGPYRLGALLGRGGMGAVYEAHDTRLNRQVAVKRLVKERLEQPTAKARLRREARTLARLHHPAIVAVHDWVEDARGLWLVMERVRGVPLSELLESGPLPLDRVLHLGQAVTEGVAAAHDAHVLHRDLKSENVLVTPEDAVCLVDFGLAKPLWPDDAESSLSQHGMVLGTLRSMSPEQARGLELDARSDLFSLGVLLYEMLSGVSPFRGETPTDTLARVCGHAPPPLSQAVPETLRDLVERLLAKDPARRPASAHGVLEALRSIEREGAGDSTGASASGAEVALPQGQPRATWAESTWPEEGTLDADSLNEDPVRPWRGWLAASGLGLALLLVGVERFRSSPSPGAASLGESAEPVEAVESPSETLPDPLPQDAEALYALGMQRLERHDKPGYTDDAIDLFRRALEWQRDSSSAHAGLARAYLVQHLDSGRDPLLLQQSQAAAQRAVELDPESVTATVSLAMARTVLGRYDDAEDLLRGLNPPPSRRVEVLEALGFLYARQHRQEEAESVLLDALEIRPNGVSLWEHLGSVYVAVRRLDDAEAAFRRTLELRPDSLFARRNVAAVLQLQGNWVEASKELRRALEIRPEATLYGNLGGVLFAQGLYGDAAEAFQKALDLGTISHTNVSWANLADAYRFIPGREEETRAAYSRAIQLTRDLLQKQPEDIVQRSRLALYLAKRGDEAESVAELRALEERHGEHPVVLYRMAVSWEVLGRRAEALDALSRALDAAYPLAEVAADPELTALRGDPDYHRMAATRRSS